MNKGYLAHTRPRHSSRYRSAAVVAVVAVDAGAVVAGSAAAETRSRCSGPSSSSPLQR